MVKGYGFKINLPCKPFKMILTRKRGNLNKPLHAKDTLQHPQILMYMVKIIIPIIYLRMPYLEGIQYCLMISILSSILLCILDRVTLAIFDSQWEFQQPFLLVIFNIF